MSLKHLFYLPFLLFFLMESCHSAMDFPVHSKVNQLHFGQGGGFSGIVNYFVLLEDGRLFHKDSRDSSYTFIARWPDGFVKQMFDNYQFLHLENVDDYEPGDLYYFIEYHPKGKAIHRIAWGRPGFKPDDHVVIFYNLLYRSAKSKS